MQKDVFLPSPSIVVQNPVAEKPTRLVTWAFYYFMGSLLVALLALVSALLS